MWLSVGARPRPVKRPDVSGTALSRRGLATDYGARRASPLALAQRRAHELERILARPFGRPRERSDLAARRVDQQCGRHAEGAADELEVLEHLGIGVRVIGKPGDADLVQPAARLVGISGIDVDGDDLERRPAELAL